MKVLLIHDNFTGKSEHHIYCLLHLPYRRQESPVALIAPYVARDHGGCIICVSYTVNAILID